MYRHLLKMPLTKKFLDSVLDEYGPSMAWPIAKIDKVGTQWKNLSDKFLLLAMQTVFKSGPGDWSLFSTAVTNAARRQDFHSKIEEMDPALPYIPQVEKLVDEGILEFMPGDKKTLQYICIGQYSTEEASVLLEKLGSSLQGIKKQAELDAAKLVKKSPGRTGV